MYYKNNLIGIGLQGRKKKLSNLFYRSDNFQSRTYLMFNSYNFNDYINFINFINFFHFISTILFVCTNHLLTVCKNKQPCEEDNINFDCSNERYWEMGFFYQNT